MRAMSHIDFYFDFSCPYAYIGATQIEAIAERYGATLSWKPMLLGGVFRGTGLENSPMDTLSGSKTRHNVQDMARWAEHFGQELNVPNNHPMRTVRALRALLATPHETWPASIHSLYRAYWIRNEDITQPEAIGAALREAGLDEGTVATALAANDEQAIKDELRSRTDEAVSRGVFGAPTMFVRDDDTADADAIMLWGQDRLHMVEAALKGWRPGSGTVEASPTPEQPVDQPLELEFWYDFSSPFAYLGSTQVERIAAEANAKLTWRPMLLGAVFKQIGQHNVPLMAMSEAKRAYMGLELGYWSSYWQVPFKFSTKFPMKTVTALRLAFLAGDKIGPVSHSLFKALWVDDGDLNDVDQLSKILTEHGLDPEEMLAATQDPATKKLLIDSTSEAVEIGIFGAPTCIVKGNAEPMLFWGQDRLAMVGNTLRGWQPTCG